MQVYAITILNQLEELERAEAKTWDLKRALASRNDFDPKKMFPEYFPEEKKEYEDDGSGVNPDDYQYVEWKSPTDAKEEWERLSAMIADGRGFLTGDEVVQQPTTGEIDWSDWQ